MIKISKEHCTGCGACAQSCNNNCILMQCDDEGFVYPIVDEDACIGCGRCESACPINTTMMESQNQPMCYAAYSKNESSRLISSSGGILLCWLK